MDERIELLKKMDEYEKEGRWNEHLNPVDYSIVLPVDENFPYVHKPLGMKCRYFIYRHTIIAVYAFFQNLFGLKTKVEGRENLRNVRTAIITCNHVNIWDCLAIRKALHGHRVYFTAAEFNNRQGFLGEMMRACRLMPIAGNAGGMKAFIHAVSELLNNEKGNYIVFYPEQAMWWNYAKSRPLMDGAFHFAAKAGVPVIPIRITFRRNRKYTSEIATDEYGERVREVASRGFTLHILPPIYPDPTKSRRENAEQMKEKNEELWSKLI